MINIRNVNYYKYTEEINKIIPQLKASTEINSVIKDNIMIMIGTVIYYLEMNKRETFEDLVFISLEKLLTRVHNYDPERGSGAMWVLFNTSSIIQNIIKKNNKYNTIETPKEIIDDISTEEILDKKEIFNWKPYYQFLTKKQIKLLELIISDNTQYEIADELGVTKQNVSNLKMKLIKIIQTNSNNIDITRYL